jgi:hypothetical protein
MKNFKISYDNRRYAKPHSLADISSIKKDIFTQRRNINQNSINSFFESVGEKGCSFCPFTYNIKFDEISPNRENFDQTQLFVLEFSKRTTYKDMLNRAKKYNLPVLFVYENLSSVDQSMFSMVFLNDVPVTDIRAADIILYMLMIVFPEADKKCDDVTGLCLGGKKLLYSNCAMPTIDLELLTMNMTYFLKQMFGDTNYKRKLKEISKDTDILLNRSNLLYITKTEALNNNQLNKNSPYSIILQFSDTGENLLNYYYQIFLNNQSVNTTVYDKQRKLHAAYRSSTLENINTYCQLYREFATGKRKHTEAELLGIASNVVEIESGTATFTKLLAEHHNDVDTDRWMFYLSYLKQSDNKPKSCYLYCPYRDECHHGNNILTTGNPKSREIVKLANYVEEFYPIDEVEQDVRHKLEAAINATDKKLYVIKAQTAIGKTEAYLDIMKELERPVLIATPTNLLKNEVCIRAQKKGINVIVTPSLDEIKDEIPEKVWKRINYLYNTGHNSAVKPYIRRVLKKENIKCLSDYLQRLKEFESYTGNVITTHRRLLLFDEEILQKYAAIIIDEDIIFRSVIPDQKAISMKNLERIKRKTTNPQLAKKITQALKRAQKDSLFELPSIEYNHTEERDGISKEVDIPSFCMSTHFCIRKASEEPTLKEDTIVYIKPAKLKDMKYIMVSATANKDICNYYFGEDRVKFVECKKARYKGTLNQYYDRSMSRSCIDNSPGIIDTLKNWSEFKRTITFMKYRMDMLHFGNTEGFDEWAGEDIDVIGTPYHAEFLYRLFAFMVDADGELTERMKPNYPIRRNGYSFRLTTYENIMLRDIHLWMIESELEQAVGRARLLRNKCTVNLFSNYPLSQANLLPSEYNYIKL